MPATLPPLWRCPKCGAKLVSRHLWHSCGKFSLAALFACSEPPVLPLFRQFAALVKKSGRVTMIPQKSRAVFMGRVRFASACPRKNWFLAGFILGRRVRHRRIVKVENFGPAILYHYVKITSAADLDATLLGWLRESYRYYGRQGRRGAKQTRSSRAQQ
jgi:hypothetical protein